jgi:F1F0 ATPase subunit 2
MINPIHWLLSTAAGGLLGLIFFGGLWLTVRGLEQARRPALRMVTSMLVRFGLVFAGFYIVVACGGWQHVVLGMVGFALVRLVFVQCTRVRGNRERAGP